MSAEQLPLLFDGHNDLLLRLLEMEGEDTYKHVLNGYDSGHLDLPRMKKGGFGGGLFAVFVPSPGEKGTGSNINEMSGSQYDLPLPPEISAKEALPVVISMIAILNRLERESKGRIKVCVTAAEIQECFNSGVIAAVIHLEGAEAIDKDFDSLEVLYRAGLRSIGPVWSRPTLFGHGVPFRYPSSPDIGPGLTDLGKKLVKKCNQLGIVVDLSHLNEAVFWDVAKISDAPLVATHSNAHTFCHHSRNLTDKQLAAIGESDGIVGLNLATVFIREDGQMSEDTSIEELLRHMDHLIEHVGIDGVGFGSDFDGATIPGKIKDVAGLVNLRHAMKAHGYDKETMNKLYHGNWLRVLKRSLK